MTVSCQSDPENKSKLNKDMPSPPHQIGGPEHIKYGLSHKEKNTNVIGICGKHDQHWSPPFKRNEHNLAEVQRRGMKKVRLDGWYQRRGGEDLSDMGSLWLPAMTRRSTQHTMACLAILGTRAAASYYSRNTAKGCWRQWCIQNRGSGPLLLPNRNQRHIAAFQRSTRELSHD